MAVCAAEHDRGIAMHGVLIGRAVAGDAAERLCTCLRGGLRFWRSRCAGIRGRRAQQKNQDQASARQHDQKVRSMLSSTE